MTSKQIQDNVHLYRFSAASEAGWLREIAYQLAVMNERNGRHGGCDLPTPPGKSSHTFHYTPDEPLRVSNNHTGSQP